MKTRLIKEILFVHVGPRRFEIQSADPNTEGQRIGFVEILPVSKVWFCEDATGRKLIGKNPEGLVFSDVFTASDFLVESYNKSLTAAAVA